MCHALFLEEMLDIPPDDGGLIATLKPGDCVTLKADFGLPVRPYDRDDVIAQVRGSSALTCGGIIIASWEDEGIILHPDRKAPVVLSDRAKRIKATLGI